MDHVYQKKCIAYETGKTREGLAPSENGKIKIICSFKDCPYNWYIPLGEIDGNEVGLCGNSGFVDRRISSFDEKIAEFFRIPYLGKKQVLPHKTLISTLNLIL